MNQLEITEVILVHCNLEVYSNIGEMNQIIP